MLSIQKSFSDIVTKVAAITSEVNRAMDRYEQRTGGCSPAEEILEMGMLLACVRRSRAMAMVISRRIPSPNQVPWEYADAIAGFASALFHFIDSCERRENAIGKKALGYRCETTV